jgi:hypothetical protein
VGSVQVVGQLGERQGILGRIQQTLDFPAELLVRSAGFVQQGVTFQ